MKIMVIGAYGHLGRLIMAEAQARGHDVVGVAHRQHAGTTQSHVIIKDMLELTPQDIAGVDAIVDAVGAWTPATEAIHYTGPLHMITLIKGTAIHYLKVGGANTLYINAAHTHTLQELPLYYPNYMQDLGSAHAEGLKVLRGTDDVNWTYVTPTYNFDPDGKRTGSYRVAGEEFKPARSQNPNDGKQDYISYADFAKGVIDIIENKQYSRQRITLFSGNNPQPTQRY